MTGTTQALVALKAWDDSRPCLIPTAKVSPCRSGGTGKPQFSSRLRSGFLNRELLFRHGYTRKCDHYPLAMPNPICSPAIRQRREHYDDDSTAPGRRRGGTGLSRPVVDRKHLGIGRGFGGARVVGHDIQRWQ
jgi:hypothetical protein